MRAEMKILEKLGHHLCLVNQRRLQEEEGESLWKVGNSFLWAKNYNFDGLPALAAGISALALPSASLNNGVTTAQHRGLGLTLR